jgi:hypothetical protein
MRIILRELVETEDSLEVGDVVGEIVITPRRIDVLLDDEERRGSVEKLLARRLVERVGDASGATESTRVRALNIKSKDFVAALLDRLEQRDLRLHGEVVE